MKVLRRPDAKTWFKGRNITNPAVFTGLAFLIVLSGMLSLYLQEQSTRKQAGMEMEVVARLRAEDLAKWRKERIADGRILSRNADFATAFKNLLSDPSDAESRDKLLTWMSRFHEHYRYERLFLFGPDGDLKLCIPEGYVDDPVLSALAASPAGLDSVQLKDFYRNPSDSRVYLSVLVPILEEARPGLLAMRIDPQVVLYPSLTRWPYLSRSPETLLVRVDGDDVVFLNPLRFDPQAVLNLRFSISGNPELPAAQAASGEKKQFDGRDYRNVPVISALSPVDGSPWFIVSKIDLAEVREGGTVNRIMMLLLVIALLGAETIGSLMLSRHWQVRVLALEAEDSRRRFEAEAKHNQSLLEMNASLERKVEQRTAELKTSNKELEAFAYSVAHDLRAPLRSIDGFACILQEDYGKALGEEGRRLLEIIRSSGLKMDALTLDLLELTKVGKIELEKSVVDMGALALEAFGICAARSVLATFDFKPGNPPAALADRSMMQQVWLNLLSNAVKYSVPGNVHRVEVDGFAEDGMNVYSVRDYGVGFDQHYAGKLFGVFQRLHGSEEFQGSGIGLSIVKKIVERHGGKVWAEGRLGQGATFHFSIPGGHEHGS